MLTLFDSRFHKISSSEPLAPDLVYQLCDDQSTLETALRSLRSAPALIIDCEAFHLGNQGGSLSIISLRPAATIEIFLIDVIRLRGALSPLFNLLESTEVVKIMFDGRMDFSALYHELGVHLRNVLDLQLVDVHSRRARCETDARRVRRLQPYLAARDIASAPELYAKAVKLSGLSQCVREHLGQSDSKPTVNHDYWLERPLPQTYLSYAATDIHLMGLLYNDFVAKRYINTTELRAQSERYVELYKDSKPARGDYYKNHPLLPLEILVAPSDDVKKMCRGCERHMGETSFLTGDSLCCVCRIIRKNNSHMGASRRTWSEERLANYQTPFT